MNALKLLILVASLLIASAHAQFEISANKLPEGGTQATASLRKTFEDSNGHVGVGGFIANDKFNRPISRGVFAEGTSDGKSLYIERSKDQFGRTFTGSGQANIFKQPPHSVDANAFHSRTTTNDGFKFTRTGGGLTYNHDRGHSASVSVSHIPQIKMTTVGLDGKANIWQSSNGRSSLDALGGMSKNFGGPFSSRPEVRAGLSFQSRF